jgi:hypothetical protein
VEVEVEVEEVPLKDRENGNVEEGKRWQTNSNAEETVTNPITPPSTRAISNTNQPQLLQLSS